MRSIDAVLDRLDEVVEALTAVDLEALAPPERFAVLERLETARRRQVAVSCAVVARLERFEGCPPLPITLADVLRVSKREANRRLREAAHLSPRTTLTGQPLPPLLPETAKAWHAGLLDGEHLQIIEKFFRDLPDHVPTVEVEKAEKSLAEHAANLRPDQLEKVAAQLALLLNPDGKFSEADRARQRGFLWCGGQRPDGMSVGKLVADPELRAAVDAWMAKYAAPGMCNPADESPTVLGEPTDEVIGGDQRSYGQRQHDALTALLRGALGDPKFGQHNGLPVTIIVSTTLQDLHNQTGHAVTAAGTRISIPDLIRMATHAFHYLALFDGATGRALWLGRTKRIATTDQRIILHSKDRGCTRPGCDAPGYHSEVHHAARDWKDGGTTDIDDLTLACGPDNQLIETSGWSTRKRPDGATEWIPPPGLPMLRGGINDFHHPERLLGDDSPPDDGGGEAA